MVHIGGGRYSTHQPSEISEIVIDDRKISTAIVELHRSACWSVWARDLTVLDSDLAPSGQLDSKL
jgi:hypothetical protein